MLQALCMVTALVEPRTEGDWQGKTIHWRNRRRTTETKFSAATSEL